MPLIIGQNAVSFGICVKLNYLCSPFGEDPIGLCKFNPLKTFCTMAEYLMPEKKQEIFAKYGKSNTDTGSAESQVALFTYRIAHLTEHLKTNKKDFGTRRALLKLVGKRRRVLDYLKEKDIERYRNIVKELGLRR